MRAPAFVINGNSGNNQEKLRGGLELANQLKMQQQVIVSPKFAVSTPARA
jgi:hypothetical protein